MKQISKIVVLKIKGKRFSHLFSPMICSSHSRKHTLYTLNSWSVEDTLKHWHYVNQPMIALAVYQEGGWKATLAKGTLGSCFVKGCFEGRKKNIDKKKFCGVEQGPLGKEETFPVLHQGSRTCCFYSVVLSMGTMFRSQFSELLGGQYKDKHVGMLCYSSISTTGLLLKANSVTECLTDLHILSRAWCWIPSYFLFTWRML